MADAPDATVRAYDRLGNKIRVPEADVPELVSLGGRVATERELAEDQLQAAWDAKPTLQKAAELAIGMGHPTLDAFKEGANAGFSAGIGQAVTRQALDAIDPKAGARYAQHVAAVKTANPTAYSAGEIAGITGQVAIGLASGGGGASRLLPANAVSALGSPIESAVGLALRGVASRGVLGRAAVTAAKLGARGAIEGAAYSGVTQAAENVLHDEPIVGEKLYSAIGHGALSGALLGAGIGAAGSLAASGARGAGRAVRGAIGRAAARTETAMAEVPGAAVAKTEPGAIQKALANPTEAARGLGRELLVDGLARGNGLQKTDFVKRMERAGGKGALGEVLERHAIPNIPQNSSPMQAALAAGTEGTAADMLPKIVKARQGVGKQIGEIIEPSGAAITRDEVIGFIRDTVKEYGNTAANRPVARSLQKYGEDLIDSMGLVEPGSKVSIQQAIEERRALSRLVFQDQATLNPKVALEARRALERRFEDVITKALDRADTSVPGETLARYKQLKKDYHALSLLEDLAEDSAARQAKAATFGLRDTMLGIAGSAATGSLGAGAVLSLGGKILKDRAHAAGGAFLIRAADTGMVARLVRQSEEQVSRAARGVLRERPPAAAKASAPVRAPKEAPVRNRVEMARRGTEDTQRKARHLMEWVGRLRANPNELVRQLTEASEIVGRSAGPKAADGYTQATLKALNFIVAHVPVKERRDPLDPRSVPPMTYEEAQRALRAAEYAVRPQAVWRDFERGRITPEGILAAQTFMPEQFAAFRQELLDNVVEHLMHNGRLTQSRRLMLDKLGIPAGADLRPSALARLQANFSEQPPPAAEETQPTQGNGPVDMRIQQSGFDAVEARKS